MTYEKIKKSIESILSKTTSSSVSDTENLAYNLTLHIDPAANTWNRAAIELAEENTKIPSRRQKIVCYPVVNAKDASGSTRMSTNEWNDLALELMRKHYAKKDDAACPV